MTDQSNNLTPSMQERLNKWKENTLPVENVEKIKNLWPLKCRPVRKDYGDELSIFEEKLIEQQLKGKK